MQKIAIIIPCYNEEKRIEQVNIDYLVNHTSASIYFANDGSTDNTIGIINDFAIKHKERCFVLDYQKNEGKAQTIFKAVNHINQSGNYIYIGYFDADFSTPAHELKRLLDISESNNQEFIFASRVLLLNSGIKRKVLRHIIGRVIITLINIKFKLGIYDTQCGAKLFSATMIKYAFATPFHTSWLFDVEIFIRLKKAGFLNLGKEVPIYNWRDVEGSKLGYRTALKIFKELYKLRKHY